MAHNLARWTARIGLGEPVVSTKTLRRRFFSLAGRLTRSARRLTLHLPQRWPWENQFSRALARLRALPLPALRRPSPTDPPSGQLNVPANSRQLSPRGTLPAYRLSNSARHGRTAAIIVPMWLPSHRPHPHLLESGLPRSPSLTHHPLCQRQGRLASVDSGLRSGVARPGRPATDLAVASLDSHRSEHPISREHGSSGLKPASASLRFRRSSFGDGKITCSPQTLWARDGMTSGPTPKARTWLPASTSCRKTPGPKLGSSSSNSRRVTSRPNNG